MARLLNAHPEIICASDPMRPIVNSFRYDTADEIYQIKYDRFYPLDDYFNKHENLLERILASDLTQKLGCRSEDLLSTISLRAKEFSGKYSDAIDTSTPLKNYKEVTDYLLNLVEAVYKKKVHASHLAFKEVWSNEFFAPISASYPQAKAIFIVRDPRAIIGSNNAGGAPYPTIFMGRQWRKLAMLARYFEETTNNTLVLRYEDMVKNPAVTMQNISNFLRLQTNLDTVNLGALEDGRGNVWRQNSNYSIEYERGIDSVASDRWRNQITASEIKSIEFFCGDWMEEFGYTLDHKRSTLNSFTVDDYHARSKSDVASWISGFLIDDDQDRLTKEIDREHDRKSVSLDAPAKEKMSMHKRWWS